MPTDIGEYLVGSYLTAVRACDYVHYDTALTGTQGDIDVIAIRLRDQVAYLCEVKTHLGGLGGYKGREGAKIREQVSRAAEYAATTLAGWTCKCEIWSPKVTPATESRIRSELSGEFPPFESVDPVFNGDYSGKVRELVDQARRDSRYVENPAYRLLQILSRTTVGSIV